MELNPRKFAEQNRKLLLIVAAILAVYSLAGYFLAPYLIKKNAVAAVHDLYGAELRIEKVAVNPFVLGVRVDGIEMDDPAGNRFASLDQFYVNFQLSSLFRWAFTFAEIRFDSPEVHLERHAVGTTNFAFLLSDKSTATREPPPADASVPRLLVYDLSLNAAELRWNDAVPAEPVATTFGPVDAQVLDLSTLPQGEGRQEVVITTETTGTFSWSGSLQLNPLRSAGRASVDGSHFPLLSAYLKDALGYEAVEGDADVELDYSIDTLADGQLDIDVDNLSLAFNDVRLKTHGRTNSVGEDADRDVLKIPSFRIDGASLRFPERMAAIDSISLEDSVLDLYRDAEGVLNIAATSDSSEPAVQDNPSTTAAEDAWTLTLDRMQVERTAITLIDDSVTPQANLGVQNINIAVTEISNSPGAIFPTEATLTTRGGGDVAISGVVGALPAVSADLDLTVEGIALAFLHPYIKSLADVNLDSGAVGLDAKLMVSDAEQLAVSGDLAVTDFLITETDEGTKLGSWDSIAAKQFVLSMSNETLEISEISIDGAYGDILITEDGRINLGRAALGEQPVVVEEELDEEQEEEQEYDPATAAPQEAEPLPLAVTIGRVVVNDAAADFEDRSLPLPFDVTIADLNGTLTTIASASAVPSAANLEGKVDEFGLVRVTGTITPLEPALDTDIKVDFENIAMPKFSAYSVPFAGRQIDSGKLDLYLGYQIEQGNLIGENKIVMREFELGEKVDHPGASSLPLGLAVALLKGPDGTIDIDLPIRGNVNDPSFRYGRVVGKALVNLVVKIVASPFALLGKLVGAEADDLEYIAFQDGRADLTPPEQEKAAKLAEALALRPELSMEISGVIDREVDGLAMQSARLDESIDQQIAAMSDGDSGQYAAQRLQVLEDMFGQKDVREALKTQYTTDAGLDDLAYATELRRQLIVAVPLEEADFVALAKDRALNVQSAILAADEALQPQIRVGALQAVEKGKNNDIQMKVVLSTGEEEDG